MTHYTYLLISSLDQKMYIGSRSCNMDPEKDVQYKSSTKLVPKEYLQNCKKYILKVHLTKIAAIEHEIFLHNLFEVGINPEFFNGAKQTSTKFDRSGIPMSDLQKERISKANIIARNTPESKLKSRNARLGVKVSQKTRDKLRKLNLKSNSPKAKPITCIETSQNFGSVIEASDWAGIHYSGIVKVCSDKQKTAGGYTWKYKET